MTDGRLQQLEPQRAPPRSPPGLEPPPEHEVSPPRGPVTWVISGVLFVATVFSVAQAGIDEWQSGWQYAAALMTILVSHEAGHYVAARLHREPASPPFFLPLPALGGVLPRLSPFGTLGAVLFLGARLRSRRALLDIGAAGPLAGLAVALPLMMYGIALSPIEPLPQPSAGAHYVQEGQSLLYMGLKWLFHGPIPPGHDIVMHPVLAAAWAGLLVTFLNLLPLGQLDGGHVAYALFGVRQGHVARVAMLVPPLALAYNGIAFGAPVASAVLAGEAVPGGAWDTLLSALAPWVGVAVLVGVIARWSGLGHPATHSDAERLGPARVAVGWLALAFFVLLFMPSPWVLH